MTARFTDIITNEEQLREVMGFPSDRAVDKAVTSIDKHCRALIERSPFMLIATSDAAGNMDISPKGDPAGFVQVLDEKTLAIPDRKGNRRADTFSNLLQNPKVGLFFLAPGYRETLRVTGTAQIVRDTALRESMTEQGKAPDLALVVHVEDAFFHCAKCVIRSSIWQPETWPDVSGIPSLAQILKDQTHAHEEVADIEEQLTESYAKNLY